MGKERGTERERERRGREERENVKSNGKIRENIVEKVNREKMKKLSEEKD
jgi:hypothetical protein